MRLQTCISIFAILFFFSRANAQDAESYAFEKIIESKFSVDLDTLDLCDAIVLNGILFAKTDIDAELKKFKASEILVTELFDLSSSRLSHQNCGYMIVLGTGDNQTQRDKERILKTIRDNLKAYVPALRIHDYSCNQCKQVVIDGRPIGIYDARAIVDKLGVKDIKYIASYKSADSAIYGRNARNGLVEMYLTKKGKRKIR